MDAGVVSSIVITAGGLMANLLITRSNRQGQAATNAVETKKVELDGKKVDLEVLTESIVNLRQDLADVREARDAADHRAQTAENHAQAANRRAEQADQRALAADRRASMAARRAERSDERVGLLAASLAAHGQWDLLVLAEVRRQNSDFPEPPPLKLPELDGDDAPEPVDVGSAEPADPADWAL